MYQICRKVLKKYIRLLGPSRILELGGGLNSTPLIRNELKKCGGFVTTLEDNPYWCNKIKRYDDEYSETILSEIVFDGIVKYSYSLKGIYDIVFIDGPDGKCIVKFKNYFSKKKHCFRSLSNGIQSIDMMTYIWPHIGPKSIVIVDCRIGSVCYYLHRYNLKYRGFGRKAISAKTVRQVKKRCKNMSTGTIRMCSVLKRS